jgi:hypothetical protein
VFLKKRFTLRLKSRELVNLLTDLWDPNKGSEFIVFNKLIANIDKRKTYRLYTMLRADNKANIVAYLETFGLSENVEVCFYPMRFANDIGNHNSKFQFIYECYIFYRWVKKSIGRDRIIRFGQPHWSFNLLCLLTLNNVIIGIISGLSIVRGISWYHFKTNLVVFLGQVSFYILSYFLKMRINGATNADVRFLHSLGIDSIRISEIPRLEFGERGRKHSHLFIWAGSFIYRKNLIELLYSWKCISTKMSLQIFGHGTYSRKYKRIELSNVIWSGSVPRHEYLKQLHRASVYITTSYQEVNSLAYYEALASGCIIFARKAGGLADFSLPGVYFYSYSDNNIIQENDIYENILIV